MKMKLNAQLEIDVRQEKREAVINLIREGYFRNIAHMTRKMRFWQ